MIAPIRVVTDCFVRGLFDSTGVLRQCMTMSVQLSGFELGSVPKLELLLPMGRTVAAESSDFGNFRGGLLMANMVTRRHGMWDGTERKQRPRS